MPHERGARQPEGLPLRVGVFGQSGSGRRFARAGEQGATVGLPFVRQALRTGETRGPGLRVHQVNIAVLHAEETRAAAHVREADEHVGRDLRVDGPAAVRDDRAERGVEGVAADHAARVDQVRGESVLVDDLVLHRANGRHVLHQLGRTRKVFADADARDGGLDRRVERAGLLLGRSVVADRLGVEGVDLAHASAEPDEDTMLGLAFGRVEGRGAGQLRSEGCQPQGGEEGAAVHRISDRGLRGS